MKSGVTEINFMPAYNEYREMFFHTGISPTNEDINKLCKRHLLKSKNNILFNYKNFSKRLKSLGLESVQEYRSRRVMEIFEEHSIAGLPRPRIVSYISDVLKIKISSVNDRLRTRGKQTRQNIKSESLSYKLRNDYMNGINAADIANKHGISVSRIKSIFNFNKISYNPDYFVRNIKLKYRKLTTLNEVNAHLYGLIWSDGSRSSYGQISISLGENDIEYLENISKSLVLEGPSPRLTKVGNKNSRYGGDVFSITIARISFYEHLGVMGLPKNKETDNHGFPRTMDSEYQFIWHYIRGFFEGDGCFTSYEKRIYAYFSVNECCCKELMNILKTEGFKPHKTRDKSIFRVTISGIAPTLLLGIKMYKDSIFTPIMQRKLEKIQLYWKNSKYEELYPNLFYDLISSKISDRDLIRIEQKLKGDFRKKM